MVTKSEFNEATRCAHGATNCDLVTRSPLAPDFVVRKACSNRLDSERPLQTLLTVSRLLRVVPELIEALEQEDLESVCLQAMFPKKTLFCQIMLVSWTVLLSV